MRYKDEDGMKNRYIQTAIVLAAAAGLLILLFFAVKTKKLQINRWIVSDRDVIGADISTPMTSLSETIHLLIRSFFVFTAKNNRIRSPAAAPRTMAVCIYLFFIPSSFLCCTFRAFFLSLPGDHSAIIHAENSKTKCASV